MAVRLRSIAPRLASLAPRIAAPPKEVDPHYLTPEHRAWRAEVIRRAGCRCEGLTCPTPHRTDLRLYADHVRELRDGGAPFDPANGQALCAACHTRKTLAARARRQAART